LRSGSGLILPGIGFLSRTGAGERPTIPYCNRAGQHAGRVSAIDESSIFVYLFVPVKSRVWPTSDEREGRAEPSK
jgi:hypothetical protein